MQSKPPAPFLRLGTRGSPLALMQANHVAQCLAHLHRIDRTKIEITIIKTEGDRTQNENLSLKDIGGKGLFSREIENQLLAGTIDVAVHSAKDMATKLPDGLEMEVFLEREDVRDAFISLDAKTIKDLSHGARLGTSSLRRAAQLRRFRPDLKIVEFRGNVETRLQKLADKIADATLLAVSGLNRLGKSGAITGFLDPKIFLPAPAQGAIGLEIRGDDHQSRERITPLNHQITNLAVTAERAMLAVLDGSCRTPIGVYSEFKASNLKLTGQILSLDGIECFTEQVEGKISNSLELGENLGRKLLAKAGPDFLAALKIAEHTEHAEQNDA